MGKLNPNLQAETISSFQALTEHIQKLIINLDHKENLQYIPKGRNNSELPI